MRSELGAAVYDQVEQMRRHAEGLQMPTEPGFDSRRLAEPLCDGGDGETGI